MIKNTPKIAVFSKPFSNFEPTNNNNPIKSQYTYEK